MLLLIIVLLLVCGGGGGYWGYSQNNNSWPHGGGFGLGTIAIVVLIIYFLGGFRHF
jgi:Protein of unknown function (DUF3309)